VVLRWGGKVLGTLKYLCFIPDMSSELFRALTRAATARDCPYCRRPAAKMAARQICPKAQRIGRARSPLCAGVGSGGLGFLSLNRVFPRSYARGYGARLSLLQKTCAQDGRAPECNNRRYGSRRRETAD